MVYRVFNREELKEQLEKKKKGSRALADFEDKMNEVRIYEGSLKVLWLHRWRNWLLHMVFHLLLILLIDFQVYMEK